MIRYGAEAPNPTEVKLLQNFKLEPGLVELGVDAGVTPSHDNVGKRDNAEIAGSYGLDIISSLGEIIHVKPEQLALTWADDTEGSSSADTTKSEEQYPKARDEISKNYGFTEEDFSEDITLAVFGDVDYSKVFGAEGETLKAKHYTKEELWDVANLGSAVLVSENPMDPFVKEARFIAEQNDIPLAVWSIARDKFNQ